MIKLNADQLRSYQLEASSHQKIKKKIKKQEIYIILDNVLDTYNIGSIFRLADAVAAQKIYLCGGTEIPPNHRIKKASINTTEWVDWEYAETALEAIKKCQVESEKVQKEKHPNSPLITSHSSLKVVAVELDERAVSYDKFDYKLPIALVVGHESDGVSKEVLDACDAIVQLPMYGVNISLNVMVSLGIVLYQVIESTKN